MFVFNVFDGLTAYEMAEYITEISTRWDGIGLEEMMNTWTVKQIRDTFKAIKLEEYEEEGC